MSGHTVSLEQSASTVPPASSIQASLARRLDEVVSSLRGAGLWDERRSDELDARFEQAAREALRRAALLERSVALRRLARRVLPARLRPLAKAAARALRR